MPIYEYECDKCGSIIEKFQTFSEKPLSNCDQCSGKLHKIISQSTFHLKGNGWYVTDYAGKTQKSLSDKTSETKAETKAETKTDKTESKTGSSEA
ncbi:MAG: zinc ribbon domain-containing protein [Proteobacteria bacterium]|nr:zinc ribbon domain-containing protein [Pseudomonadota bacterium]MBU4470237.1 zinc ribbon domain-containing protein [Pseudomonadota bacterium]MCG2752652.1 zinc ribbon domain-containing protein [Desulfobacteraceae bacterium]